MELKFSGHICEKYSNTKFQISPSGRSRFVLCGQTDEQTDVTKPIVAFRDRA